MFKFRIAFSGESSPGKRRLTRELGLGLNVGLNHRVPAFYVTKTLLINMCQTRGLPD